MQGVYQLKNQRKTAKKVHAAPPKFPKNDAQKCSILAHLQLTEKFFSKVFALLINWKTQFKVRKKFTRQPHFFQKKFTLDLQNRVRIPLFQFNLFAFRHVEKQNHTSKMQKKFTLDFQTNNIILLQLQFPRPFPRHPKYSNMCSAIKESAISTISGHVYFEVSHTIC